MPGVARESLDGREPFTAMDIHMARICVEHAGQLKLTDSETSACMAIIEHARCGTAVEPGHIRAARFLFNAMLNGKGDPTRPGRAFTARDVNLARVCLIRVADPYAFHITEPERRACLAVLRYAESDEPITEEDLHIAKALFRAIADEESRIGYSLAG